VFALSCVFLVQTQPRQTQERAGGMAQVIEYLPSKCEALSLNPVPPKKNLFLEDSL
jgi:hypothetical protein